MLLAAAPANAAVLALYEFPSSAATATTEGTGVTAGDFAFTNTTDEGAPGGDIGLCHSGQV